MKGLDQSRLETSLSLLGELLDALRSEPIHLVVIGGSALLASGTVTRTTGDVDILARRGDVDGEIIDARPLPEYLKDAAAKVADELRLPSNWLNASAALCSLPFDKYPNDVFSGLVEREYGGCLRISFMGRSGLIYLKFHAAIEPERTRRKDDRDDLQHLAPTVAETERAIDWLFREELVPSDRIPELKKVLETLNHGSLISRIEKLIS